MVLEEAWLISRKLLPAKPASTLDSFEPEAVGPLDPRSVLEISDGWRAKPMDSFRPFEFGKSGELRPSELGRSDSKKLATPSEPGGRQLAGRSHGLDDRPQVSLDPNPSAISIIELGDDDRMSSRAVKRRSNGKVDNTANFEPTQPDPSLDAVVPAGNDEGTLGLNAGARPGDNRVSISSLLMADQNGRVYYQIIQAGSEDGEQFFDLPGQVLLTEIQLISTNEIGQLQSKGFENRESDCLLNMGGRTAPGSALAPDGCAVQQGVDGKPHLMRPKGSVDGSDCVLPFVEGNPIQLAPGLVQVMNGGSEVRMGTGGGAGARGATDVTLLLQSMTFDKLAVLLPIVMIGTLLLVLIIFGMTFCCLRQAEETYHINIRAVGDKRHRYRNSRRRRKNNASTGAAEEGDITAPPGASVGQHGAGSTRKGWFLQRWYNSLRGDAAPKKVSFASAEVISHPDPRSIPGWVKGLDGGQDTRDPSYVLDAVSNRLQQTEGRPRRLSAIWSDDGPGSSFTSGTVLTTGRGRSEDASPNAAVMSRKMHGAKGDTSTNFRQEFMSTTETTGRSGDPSSDLTPTHSPGKLEHQLSEIFVF